VARFLRQLLIAALLSPFSSAAAQTSFSRSPAQVEITPMAGYLAFGTYTGPGDIRFSNQDGLGYGGQLGVTVWRNLSVVGGVIHGTSDWSFEAVPFLGSISVGGASLWFFDLNARLGVPLSAASPVSAFAQVGAGAIRYPSTTS
jgi:hypothetical protein